MISFNVQDMTCGHCVQAVTAAVHATDPEASVAIDLPAHRVRIEPVAADAAALHKAIEEAGFTPVAVP